MPRIYDSAGEPLDFCKHCFPRRVQAERKYGNVAKTGEGPDGRNCFEYDAEHPVYRGTEEVVCVRCGTVLDKWDNEMPKYTKQDWFILFIPLGFLGLLFVGLLLWAWLWAWFDR